MRKKLMILLFIFILITGNLSLTHIGKAGVYYGYEPPYEAENPYPKNNEKCVPPRPILSVDLPDPPDPDGDMVQVCFIDASDSYIFAIVPGITNGGTISAPQWKNATTPGETYHWYVIITDIWLIPTRSPQYPENWSFTIDLPPDKPSNPKPVNNERYVNATPLLSVDVSDPDGNTMNVTFYDATNNGKRVIGVVNNVASGETASLYWKDCEYGTTYKWYAVANDSIMENCSDIFSFTTDCPINISFPRRISWSGVKAKIINIGDRDVSKVSWEISITGGLLNKINISKNGVIDRLNINESSKISSHGFLDFKSKVFGIGRVNVTIKTSDIYGKIISLKTREAFVIGSLLVLLD
jgi:hypothetical protein